MRPAEFSMNGKIKHIPLPDPLGKAIAPRRTTPNWKKQVVSSKWYMILGDARFLVPPARPMAPVNEDGTLISLTAG